MLAAAFISSVLFEEVINSEARYFWPKSSNHRRSSHSCPSSVQEEKNEVDDEIEAKKVTRDKVRGGGVGL